MRNIFEYRAVKLALARMIDWQEKCRELQYFREREMKLSCYNYDIVPNIITYK